MRGHSRTFHNLPTVILIFPVIINLSGCLYKHGSWTILPNETLSMVRIVISTRADPQRGVS
jgi:hypothetical protein